MSHKEYAEDQYIKIGKRTINVIGEIDFTDPYELRAAIDNHLLIDGKGYVDTSKNIVRVYKSSRPVRAGEAPYFWIKSDTEINISDPCEDIMNEADASRIMDQRLSKLIEGAKDNKPKMIDQRLQELTQTASAKTYPLFKTYDDFLKLIVKAVLIDKQYSLNALPQTGALSHLINNMRQALIGTTKMSTTYFNQWSDIVGFKVTVIVEEDGKDPAHILERPLVYKSEFNKMYRQNPDGSLEEHPEIALLALIDPDTESKETQIIIDANDDSDSFIGDDEE